METKYYHIDKIDKSLDKLKEAGNIIQEGGLVAFPTETVYGLGGDALNKQSAQKIYKAKGRPSDNPLIVHIAKVENFYSLINIVDRPQIQSVANKLIKHFWPGPLTIILPKADIVPYEITGGLETVAIRMPQNEIALKLIENSGGYIAAPSANISGKPSPTRGSDVLEDLEGKIELVLEAGESCIGLESTILDLTVIPPCLLRPGYVTVEMLQEVIGEVEIDPTILEMNEPTRAKAPGMKYKHYAPNAELVIVSGTQKAVTAYINEQIKVLHLDEKRIGVIHALEEEQVYLADVTKYVGERQNQDSIANNLYAVLREFDRENVDMIFSESFDTKGIGQAIMNRLIKAAGHQIKYVIE